MSTFYAALVKQRMTEHISARLDAGVLEGVCGGVWIGGEQVVDVCLGQRDPAANTPMTKDSLFRLASMTKPVAGCAAMQMVEAGKLELDAPISRWLPAYENMEVAIATPARWQPPKMLPLCWRRSARIRRCCLPFGTI